MSICVLALNGFRWVAGSQVAPGYGLGGGGSFSSGKITLPFSHSVANPAGPTGSQLRVTEDLPTLLTFGIGHHIPRTLPRVDATSEVFDLGQS